MFRRLSSVLLGLWLLCCSFRWWCHARRIHADHRLGPSVVSLVSWWPPRRSACPKEAGRRRSRRRASSAGRSPGSAGHRDRVARRRRADHRHDHRQRDPRAEHFHRHARRPKEPPTRFSPRSNTSTACWPRTSSRCRCRSPLASKWATKKPRNKRPPSRSTRSTIAPTRSSHGEDPADRHLVHVRRLRQRAASVCRQGAARGARTAASSIRSPAISRATRPKSIARCTRCGMP